jgi:hypothetical protein
MSHSPVQAATRRQYNARQSNVVASRIESLERLIRAEAEIRHHPIYGISASRVIAAARVELAELRHPQQ